MQFKPLNKQYPWSLAHLRLKVLKMTWETFIETTVYQPQLRVTYSTIAGWSFNTLPNSATLLSSENKYSQSN